MPWTLSHPAAVLPLHRLAPVRLDLAALVVGSMTPDAGYYINRFDLADFAHTLTGSVLACLPTGLIILVVFYLFARPVCYALPSPHREALLPRCPDFPRHPRSWIMILISLLVGAWTHNFWDAFTHEHGWFVTRIPWLQEQAFRVGSTSVGVFLLLQELSTIVGFVVIVIAYWSWLRRHRPASSSQTEGNLKRYLFWFGLGAVAFLISFPMAISYTFSHSLEGLPFYRAMIFRTAIYSPAVATPLLLLGATWLYARRPQNAGETGQA
ncbi:MAG: DUF4184 family protein [Chthoniobacterales bacterium]